MMENIFEMKNIVFEIVEKVKDNEAKKKIMIEVFKEAYYLLINSAPVIKKQEYDSPCPCGDC